MRTYETRPQEPDDATQSYQVNDQLVIRGESAAAWIQGADPVEVER